MKKLAIIAYWVFSAYCAALLIFLAFYYGEVNSYYPWWVSVLLISLPVAFFGLRLGEWRAKKIGAGYLTFHTKEQWEEFSDKLIDAAKDTSVKFATATAKETGEQIIELFEQERLKNLDPTDIRILRMIEENPKLKDDEIASRLRISRQALNTRRRALEKAGYKVR